MTFRSHIALGAIGGLLVAQIPAIHNVSPNFYAQYLPFIVLGSIFPDIDEPRSFIGRKLPGISHLVSLTFTHRGFTHFLICPILLAVLAGFFLDQGRFYIYALSFGMFMHQIGDMITKSGIPYYFYPFKLKAVLLPKKLRFKTGGMIEWVIFLFLLLPILGGLIYFSHNGIYMMDSLNPQSFTKFYRSIL